MAAPTFLICVITSYAALASGADLCYTSGNGQEIYCDGGVCTGSSCLSAGEIVGFVMAGLTVLLLIGCLVKCCFCNQGGRGV
ncbi:hypothetical protein V1264_009596 [Littorina saxatilis]|uniref:Uncharacterized protein n=1 Tax=Littorina saxatilis TaxID=31220 RepID=A0AAN9G1Z1_9CAEN